MPELVRRHESSRLPVLLPTLRDRAFGKLFFVAYFVFTIVFFLVTVVRFFRGEQRGGEFLPAGLSVLVAISILWHARHPERIASWSIDSRDHPKVRLLLVLTMGWLLSIGLLAVVASLELGPSQRVWAPVLIAQVGLALLLFLSAWTARRKEA